MTTAAIPGVYCYRPTFHSGLMADDLNLDLVKVGKGNSEKRIFQQRAAMFFHPEIVFWIPAYNALQVEKEFHRQFKAYRYRHATGVEWYANLPLSEAEAWIRERAETHRAPEIPAAVVAEVEPAVTEDEQPESKPSFPSFLEDWIHRSLLQPRSAPYFVKVAKGKHIGWRFRGTLPGVWVIRRAMSGGRYNFTTLGPADDAGHSGMTFREAAAVAAASSTVNEHPDAMTVADALGLWVSAKILFAKSDAVARNYEYEAGKLSAELGHIHLHNLSPVDIENWRTAQLAKAKDKKIAKASLDRRLATLKAALNLAAKEQAWALPWDHVQKFGRKAA